MSSDDNAEARFTPPAPPPTIDPGHAIASPSTPAWSCTVSVRALCEFTAKHGDLDRRFTPSATALEGLALAAEFTLSEPTPVDPPLVGA